MNFDGIRENVGSNNSKNTSRNAVCAKPIFVCLLECKKKRQSTRMTSVLTAKPQSALKNARNTSTTPNQPMQSPVP